MCWVRLRMSHRKGTSLNMTHIVPVLQTLQITSWSSKKEWACACVSSLLGVTGEFSNRACFTVNHNSWLTATTTYGSSSQCGNGKAGLVFAAIDCWQLLLWSGWASQLLLPTVHDWPEKIFESVNDLRTLTPRVVHVAKTFVYLDSPNRTYTFKACFHLWWQRDRSKPCS